MPQTLKRSLCLLLWIPVSVTVRKAVPEIRNLKASAITYGQSLNDSQLTADVRLSGEEGTVITGALQWKDAFAKPSVSDSKKTEYGVEFIPEDSANYEPVEAKLTLEIKKAAHPAQLPTDYISVPFSVKKVSDELLADTPDWAFEKDASDQPLESGKKTVFTLHYRGSDAGNYEQETAKITILRAECEHSGETELRGEKAAFCTGEGFSGDLYCSDCGELIRAGVTTPATGHTEAKAVREDEKKATCTEGGSYEEVICCSECGEELSRRTVLTEATGKHEYGEWETVREPGYTQEGLRRRVCEECGEVLTETIPKLQAISIKKAKVTGLKNKT